MDRKGTSPCLTYESGHRRGTQPWQASIYQVARYEVQRIRCEDIVVSSQWIYLDQEWTLNKAWILKGILNKWKSFGKLGKLSTQCLQVNLFRVHLYSVISDFPALHVYAKNFESGGSFTTLRKQRQTIATPCAKIQPSSGQFQVPVKTTVRRRDL